MQLRTPALAVLGLLAVGAVALQLVTGGITLAAAAVRVGTAVVVLVLADRLLVPLARALVGPRPADRGDADQP